jgi:translation initiation factor 1A
MPPKKGKTGGKKGKRGKKNPDADTERVLVFKDTLELQEYGQIERLLGNCRCEVKCIDGISRLGHIRGTMRKKVWIKVGDIVLISLREYEDAKCDIIYLYKIKESKMLKSYGELPENIKINEDLVIKEEEEDIGIDFEEEDSEAENAKEDKEKFKKEFEENFENI